MNDCVAYVKALGSKEGKTNKILRIQEHKEKNYKILRNNVNKETILN